MLNFFNNFPGNFNILFNNSTLIFFNILPDFIAP